MNSPWLKPEQVAQYLGKDINRVYQWIRSGSLESHKDPDSKIGVLVNKADVDKMVYAWPSGASSPQQP